MQTQQDNHMKPWIERTFGLTVIGCGYGDYAAYDTPDYGHDTPKGISGYDAFTAAMDWAVCYNGPMFDRMDFIACGGEGWR